MWVTYGLVMENKVITLVNSVGIVASLYYILIYWFYTSPAGQVTTITHNITQKETQINNITQQETQIHTHTWFFETCVNVKLCFLVVFVSCVIISIMNLDVLTNFEGNIDQRPWNIISNFGVSVFLCVWGC
jgi:hypothetical protein